MRDVIKIENVSKTYNLYKTKYDPILELLFNKSRCNRFNALSNFSYTFHNQCIYGILGRNGSGKSTLLKLISGITEPNIGNIETEGIISFLNINVGLDKEFTGRENIYFKGMLMGLNRSEITEKIDEIIEFSELGVFIEQPVKTYSSGMKSRLGFAISVIIDADILIIDEALSVGDSKFKKKCRNKINDFFDKDKTIIYVSHNSKSVLDFCQEVLWLEKGELIMAGDAKKVVDAYEKFNKSDMSITEYKKVLKEKKLLD